MIRGSSAFGLVLAGCVASAEPEPRAQQQPPAETVEPGDAGVPASRGGQDLIGQPAKAWGELSWLNSAPLRLEELRGQVVLVRFWTDTCPFCAATAPALAKIHDDYAERGLVVLGFYHPKPRGSAASLEVIERRAEELGIRFPIAVDERWATLDDWWLSGRERAATSVSFLLDRDGRIRFVHPGPEFSPESERERSRRDHEQVRQAIEALLAG